MIVAVANTELPHDQYDGLVFDTSQTASEQRVPNP
jgi:hypothetical protein